MNFCRARRPGVPPGASHPAGQGPSFHSMGADDIRPHVFVGAACGRPGKSRLRASNFLCGQKVTKEPSKERGISNCPYSFCLAALDISP